MAAFDVTTKVENCLRHILNSRNETFDLKSNRHSALAQIITSCWEAHSLKQSYLQSLFESYSFFGNIFTADEGPEVDVGEEAAVWTNILLISPVLFIQCECPIPHIGTCVADCGPNIVDY